MLDILLLDNTTRKNIIWATDDYVCEGDQYKKDREIKNLKRELAKQKLYSEQEDEQQPERTKDDCINAIFNPNICNYDYAVAVLDLVDIEVKAGRKNPLGKNKEGIKNG